MNTFKLFFSWPDGGVWSNLIASAITFTLGMVAHYHFVFKPSMKRLHKRLDYQDMKNSNIHKSIKDVHQAISKGDK